MNTSKNVPAGNHSLRRPNPVGGCPLTAAFAAIGGKWKLITVYWLAESPRHFAALGRLMPGISPKVLTRQLRELAGDGIVHRRRKGQTPAPVEYSLTEYGRELIPLVEAIRVWGRKHLEHLADHHALDTPTRDGQHSGGRSGRPRVRAKD